MSDTIETSYALCRRISRRAGSTFHAGFILLPREQRRAMEAIYAFMRYTDDLADDAASDGEDRRERLAVWRAAVREALGDAAAKRSPLGPAPRPMPLDSPSLQILPALAAAARRFCIPHEHFYAVLDGVEMDLDGRQYETFEELEAYCERVASAVGLACIHIWGFRGPEAIEPARRAGIALQLTNILRDIREDAAAGRIYLPTADLRACGFQPEEFLTMAASANLRSTNFRRLIAMEIARAERFYADAIPLLKQLEQPGRRMFGLMMDTYGALLREIARRPESVLRGRVRVGRFRKLRLFIRWMLRP